MSRYFNSLDMGDGSSELYHYGVQGMKWGIRKYVNYDGTLTAEGKRRYGTYENFAKSSSGRHMIRKAQNQEYNSFWRSSGKNGMQAVSNRERESYPESMEMLLTQVSV